MSKRKARATGSHDDITHERESDITGEKKARTEQTSDFITSDSGAVCKRTSADGGILDVAIRQKERSAADCTKTRTGQSNDDIGHTREKNKAYQRKFRTGQTPDDKSRARRTNAALRREARAAQTADKAENAKATNTAYRKKVRAAQTADKAENAKATNTAYRKKVRAAQTADKAENAKATITAYRKKVRAAQTADKAENAKATNTAHRKKVRAAQTADKAENAKATNTANRKKVRAVQTADTAEHARQGEAARKRNARAVAGTLKKNFQSALRLFKKHMEDGPHYICTVCHRLMFRTMVLLFSGRKYPKTNASLLGKVQQHLIETVLKAKHGHNILQKSLFICRTCDRSLKRNMLPVQAVANNLLLTTIPDELNGLNEMEVRLISQRIAFKKLLALPRGGQRAIKGSVVNIPTDMTHLTTLLPRLPEEAELVNFKLKRKLQYTGHHMRHTIRPQRVNAALLWLRRNNPLYKDITINSQWEQQWKEADPEVWQAMTDEAEGMSTSSIGKEPSATEPCSVQQDSPPSTQSEVLHLVPPPQLPATITTQHPVTSEFPPTQTEPCSVQQDSPPSTLSEVLHLVPPPQLPATITTQHPVTSEFPPTQTESEQAGPSSGQPSTASLFFRPDIPLPPYKPHRHDSTDEDLLSSDEDEMMLLPTIQTPRHPRHTHDKVKSSQHTCPEHLLSRETQQPDLDGDLSLSPPREAVEGNLSAPGTSLFQKDIFPLHEEAPDIHSDSTVVYDISDDFQKETFPLDEEAPDVDSDSTVVYDISDDGLLPLEKSMCYNTLLQLENPNNTFSVAPGENQVPLPFLNDPHFEQLAYPDKYPFGVPLMNDDNRPRKITPRKYFNQRVLNFKGNFGADVDYLLTAQYICEAQQVRTSANIMLRQTRGELFEGGKINAGMLKNAERLRGLIRTDNAYKFLKNVRGTPAFWQTALYDTLAMMRQLSCPTFFLTLSPADLQWPEIIMTIAHQHGKLFTPDDIKNMSWEKKTHWLRTNPVTAARMFQYRVESWFKDVLLAAQPVGVIEDYMIRIEFQARGSPHAHCLLWTKDAPRLDVHSDGDVISFINRYQHCHLPEDQAAQELVTKLQRHSHTKTCQRRGSCRFHYPRPPTPDTWISRPALKPSDDSSEGEKRDFNQRTAAFDKALSSVKELLETDPKAAEGMSLDDLLRAADVDKDMYLAALKISKSGHHILLQRTPSEMNINSYNLEILQSWSANMDIQYITDPYACIMYVTSYMLKQEKGMSELLQKVGEEARDQDIKDKLKQLGTTFLNHREVSAQEAAYRLLSMPLKRCSRKVVFINTSRKEKRVRMTRPLSEITLLDSDDEDLFYTSPLERYSARPLDLENMCLAEFYANYQIGTSTNDDTADNIPNILHDEGTQGTIILSNSKRDTMKKRKREAIIRFYKEKEHGEEHFRIQLMLYLPWRNEDIDLKRQFASYEEHFKTVQNTINTNCAKYTHNDPDAERAERDLAFIGPPEHAWDQIAPGAQEQEHQQREEGATVVHDHNMEPDNVDLQNQHMPGSLPYTCTVQDSTLSQEQYLDMMRKLNPQQRQFMTFHRKWCKDALRDMKKNIEPTPYHVFLSGPGGVGKSHIIKLVYHDTMHLLRLSGMYSPEELPVLLTAYTGVAAFNINGSTLHSALSLQHAHKSLSSDKLNTLRAVLSKLKLLIIDEVSMVGKNHLNQIHQRLQTIIGTPNATYGNVSILAVGDFYQLKPVGQKHIFHSAQDDPKFLQNLTLKDLACCLWQQHFRLFELSTSMRQQNDQPFAELLNRMRVDNLSAEDETTLQTRELSADEATYPQDAHRVFTTNVDVDAFNQLHIQHLQTQLFCIEAKDKTRDTQTNQLNVAFPEKPSDTGNLRKFFNVAVGARVMLTNNIDVSDGLANGACGTVAHIVTTPDKNVHCVLVNFDEERVGKQAAKSSPYRHLFPQAVPIERIEASFSIKGLSANRLQFPLTLAWATTIHKVQGKTLDEIVVSFKGRFDAGQAYVACSRVKTLSGLHITDFNTKAVKSSPAVETEMKRMREHSQLQIPTLPTNEPSNNVLTLFLQNSRSYSAHYEDIQIQSQQMKPDIVCVVETHLTTNQNLSPAMAPLPNMEILRQDRATKTSREKGGILIAVDQELCPTHLPFNNMLECLGAKITKDNTVVHILTVYRKPSLGLPTFLENLESVLQHMDLTFPTLVVGDFNVDLLENPQSDLIAMMTNHGFTQHVKEPTRHSGSLLDHVYSNTNLPLQISVLDSYYSDHDGVFAQIHLS